MYNYKSIFVKKETKMENDPPKKFSTPSKECEQEKDKILVCGSDKNGEQEYSYGFLLISYMLASSQDSPAKDQTFLIKNQSPILGLVNIAKIKEPEWLGQVGEKRKSQRYVSDDMERG